jgi:hypothetical protein
MKAMDKTDAGKKEKWTKRRGAEIEKQFVETKLNKKPNKQSTNYRKRKNLIQWKENPTEPHTSHQLTNQSTQKLRAKLEIKGSQSTIESQPRSNMKNSEQGR